jgi:glutamate-5-semialdehyde dehydrogenase
MFAVMEIGADNPSNLLKDIAISARSAAGDLANTTAVQRQSALEHSAGILQSRVAEILVANTKDMALAEQKGLDSAMLDRLKLDEKRVQGIAQGLRDIAALPDPLGKTLAEWDRPNGLHIQRVSVPLGVIGIIYESRPNVTADAGGLCIKSGNAAILRGGSESFHSSQAIVACLHEGLRMAGLPEAAVQLVPSTDRAFVSAMLNAVGLIDIIVPRGGKGLTARVQAESRIPTILHLDGNCHSYVHAKADIDKAAKLIANAKMRRTGVCGATESLIFDRAVLAQALPKILDALEAAGCKEYRGDAEAQQADKRVRAASEGDWSTEYLAPILSIKTLENVAEAIAHINRYGSHHTDCIITEDAQAAAQFQREVDSAIVMHNTSTQFADGGEFGMGAEIGISTGRLHARGPVGAEQLTTYKYVVSSNGSIRS